MKEVNVKKKSQGRKLIIIVNLGGLRIWVWHKHDPRGQWIDVWIPPYKKDPAAWHTLNELISDYGGFRYSGPDGADGNRWCFPRPMMAQGLRALLRMTGDAGGVIERLD